MEIVIENPSESNASTPINTITPEPTLSTPSLPDCATSIPVHPFHRTRAATLYDSEYNYNHNYGHEYNYSSVGPIPPNFDNVYRGSIPGICSQRFRRASAPSGDPDGTTVISVRRVDKSGLLEISEVCPASGDWQRQVPGMDTLDTLATMATVATHVGSMSRRIDRTGLLEAVPEDRCSPCMDEDQDQDQDHDREPNSRVLDESRHFSAAEVTGRVRESVEQPKPRLSSFEALARNTLRRLTKTSVDQQSIADPGVADGQNSVEAFAIDSSSFRLGGVVGSGPLVVETPVPSATERRDAGKETVTNKREDVALNSPLSSRETRSIESQLSKAPDLIESTRDAVQDRIQALEKGKGEPPEGERAEAEGCEHSAIDVVEERRTSSKSSGDSLRADNVQTLRVIILSEQL